LVCHIDIVSTWTFVSPGFNELMSMWYRYPIDIFQLRCYSLHYQL